MNSQSELIELIEKLPYPATFKAAENGRYICSNAANSRHFGVENPADLTGLTIHDLQFEEPTWGHRFAHKIESLDYQVREEKVMATETRSILVSGGRVRHEEAVKFPVIGANKKVLGIVSYTQDLTPSLSCADLYREYRSFYGKADALKRVLACYGLESNFLLLPTDAQFRVLVKRAQGYSHKEMARHLGISPRTVESHVAGLRDKVLDGDLDLTVNLLKERISGCVS